MMRTALSTAATYLLTQLVACGGTLSDAEARQQRQRLRDAMGAEVASREQRDEQSRLLADIAASGALDGLNDSELRAAFGPGQACRSELCAEKGFSASDWFYEIGRSSNPEIEQVPLLMIGFDARGRAVRVFTLTTH